MIEKILYIRKNPCKASGWLASQIRWLLMQLGNLGRVTIPKPFCNFYPHSNLETVFPALKLTKNMYIDKYDHFHFLKTGNLIIKWISLSLLQTLRA